MLQPGRNVSAGNYRYGFNGKEQDTAINGSGVDYDYGFRIYDARVGRFYSIDPLQKKYPSETPYHFCGNNPTNYADKDGRDTFRIYNSTVVYPPINSKLDGVVISKGGTVSNSTYSIAPARGEDVFYYNVVQTVIGINGAISTTNIEKRFYPNASGGSQFFGGTQLPGIEGNDDDFTTLAKIAPDCLVQYLELKDPDNYGALGLHRAFLRLGENLKTASSFLLILESGAVLVNSAKEAVAARELSQIEEQTGGHFFSRHGAQTTIEQQLTRAKTGVAPDGYFNEIPPDATRFLTHEDQLEAVKQAQKIYKETGQKSFNFAMKNEVGEGYLSGGNSGIIRTTKVHAQFKNGKLNTLYPKLK